MKNFDSISCLKAWNKSVFCFQSPLITPFPCFPLKVCMKTLNFNVTVANFPACQMIIQKKNRKTEQVKKSKRVKKKCEFKQRQRQLRKKDLITRKTYATTTTCIHIICMRMNYLDTRFQGYSQSKVGPSLL